MTSRARLLTILAPATIRRAPWGTVVGCIAAALAATWLVASRDSASTGQVLTALRWSAVILTAGVAGVLDDPTEDDTAGAGVPIWQRRVLALGLLAIPTAAGWAVAIAITDRSLPWVASSVEAAALVLIGVAVASTRRLRIASVPAGLVAATLPAAILLLGPLLPPAWALLVDPDDAAWHGAHVRWGLLVVLATATLLITSRDPARRSAWRVLHPATPRSRRRRSPATHASPATNASAATHASPVTPATPDDRRAVPRPSLTESP